MTNQHPITPPSELVEQWAAEAMKGWRTNGIYERDIATQAAQWGADQELESCCEWLAYEGHEHEHLALRASRRPKPPSLKEQALAIVTRGNQVLASEEQKLLRRALEALDD